MEAAADPLAFAPPPEPAALRGFVLAIIAHVLLVIALSLGINWDKDTPPAAVEAELWSALPQEAAPPPAAVPAPPPPRPEPQPEVKAPVAVEAPPPPVTREPDIALEREKKRKEQQAKRREEEEDKRRALDAKRKLEEDKRIAQDKREREREELAKKDKQQQERDARLRELARRDQMARITAMAGAGSPASQGSAQRSAGPSDSYAGRIRARVKPNVVFSEDLPGNPSAEVEVRMAPDGTIVSRKITKASGVKAWDDAVLRALDKTEVLPRDVDGRVHTPLIIAFKLRD